MEKKTKDTNTYILVNLILLLIAFLLTLFIVIEYKMNKTNIVSSMSEQTNVIVSSIQAEKETEKGTENTQVVVPVILDNNVPTNISTTNCYKYYYNQLDGTAKKIYNTIENNIENIKSGTYVINLSDDITSVLNDSNGQEKLNIDFQSAWDAICLDRVDLFYIDISKITLKIKTITSGNNIKHYVSMQSYNNEGYLENGFQNEQIVDMALSQVNNSRNEIVSSLSGNNYNKIMQAHDWLVDNVEYGTEKSGNNAYNIYGTFEVKSVVCEGYAETFKYIMDDIGIPCVLVSGTATNSEGTTENHEWNYVQIDGKWYGLDATWDDPIISGGGKLTKSLKYKYFLKGSEVMNKNHFPNGKISTSGITFTYPTIESKDY